MGLGLALSCLPDVDIPTPLAPNACGDGVVQYSLGEECDPGDAGAVGCSSACRLACDGGVLDPWTRHCYFSTTPTNTLANARQLCSTAGGHLVTFASYTELGFVTDHVLDGGIGWLDLERVDNEGGVPFFQTDDNREPGWRGGLLPQQNCTGCYAKNSNPLAGKFPVPDGGIDGRGVIFGSDIQTTWFAVPLDVDPLRLAVICEREVPGRLIGPCDAGTCVQLSTTSADSLYVVVTTPARYSDAKMTCINFGARLVVLQNAEEREGLTRALAGAINDVWIGLATQADTWMWADGTPTKAYDPWAQGEPGKADGGAAYLHIDDAVYDTRLAHADALASMHPFVCEIDLRK